MNAVLFKEIGFDQLIFVPELIFIQKRGNLTGIAVKKIDDVLSAGDSNEILSVIKLV